MAGRFASGWTIKTPDRLFYGWVRITKSLNIIYNESYSHNRIRILASVDSARTSDKFDLTLPDYLKAGP